MSLEGPATPSLQIESIRVPGGGMATFAPNRGGMVTSLKLNGREVLYMDPATLLDRSKNVRGGIPILFPNAGPVKSALYSDLPQHGFARTSSHWESDIAPYKNAFTEWLRTDEEIIKIYPYKFLLEVGGLLERSKFTITQSVTNLEEYKDVPIAMGLHPYFPVRAKHKSDIKFNFAGGEVLEAKRNKWMHGEVVSIDNPKEFALNAEMRVYIPELGWLVLEASAEYKKIWVWSLPDQNFICIEPVMRDEGGLVDEPQYLAPAEIYSARFSIKMDR